MSDEKIIEMKKDEEKNPIKETCERKMKELEGKFEEIKNRKAKIIEQKQILEGADRELEVELFRLQGEHRAYSELVK